MRKYFWGMYWYESKQTWSKIICYADSFAEAQDKVSKALSTRSDITMCIIFPFGGED